MHRSGSPSVLKSPFLSHFKTDEGHVAKIKSKGQKDATPNTTFFSPKKSDHPLSHSPPTSLSSLSYLPLSSSPSPPPSEHHSHRNQSLPEKKGKTRQRIRILKRAKDLCELMGSQASYTVRGRLVCSLPLLSLIPPSLGRKPMVSGPCPTCQE